MTFQEYINKNFEYLEIKKVVIYKEKKIMEVYLSSNKILKDENEIIGEYLKKVFPSHTIYVYISMDKIKGIVDEVREYIENSRYKNNVSLDRLCLDGDTLHIFVDSKNIKEDLNEENEFIEICNRYKDININYLYKEKVDLEDFYDNNIVNNIEYVELSEKQINEKKIEDKDEKVIGKFPKDYNIIDIKDLAQGKKSVILGTIYGIEDGKVSEFQMKNGNYIIRFDLEDNSSTISCKWFLKNSFYELFHKICKEGNTVILNGKYVYDDYDNEYTFMVDAAMKGIKVSKKDKAEKKRIEFNLHSQMSNLDGLISVNSYADILDQMEWKEAAISDNYVVQAFPTLYRALKSKGIKLNLGLEGKILDDHLRILTNLYNEEYSNKKFTVFDIETTGLSKFNDRITEIGAVRVENGRIVKVYNELINPEMNIPEKIVELTGITNEMVANRPTIDEILPGFIEFAKGTTFVAHNADFDIGFIIENMKRLNLPFKPVYIDTLNLARALNPDLKNHRLNTLAKKYSVSLENHHRASDDAYATAEIFLHLCMELEKKGIEISDNLNKLETAYEVEKNYSFNELIYARNKEGLKNLYRLVSLSATEYFYRTPGIPRSKLNENRKGLLIGSGGHKGRLYKAIADGYDKDKIIEIAQYYDFLQIEPDDMYDEFIHYDNLIASRDHAIEINKKIVEIGKMLDIPVIATGDVYYLNNDEYKARNVIKNYQRKTYLEKDGLHRLRTTEEMLDTFSYLGKDAYEVVVENTHKLSGMIEDIPPIPPGTFTPVFENAAEDLREINFKNARKIYGDDLPEIVEKRLNKELNSIISNGYATLYLVARELVLKSNKDGYVVGSRGSVGSSLVATMSEITEINPLIPHYICPKCKNVEFIGDNEYSSGVDLPDKKCPVCGSEYIKEGQDIPFEVFLGFEGDKEPDIDLNFAGEYQGYIHKYTEVLFGEGKVFRAGTIGEIKEKTAFGYIKKFFENYPELESEFKSSANLRKLARNISGTRRTTGQHAGGLIIVPVNNEILDFTPIQYPADDKSTNILTTHFNYRTLEETLLKLDLLGHNVPSIIKQLENLTGIDPMTIPIGDKATMALFSSTDSLDIKHEYSNMDKGTLGIPEFGTQFTMSMLEETKPTTFGELVRISGLSHGTNVWVGNAQDLILNGITDLKHSICTRDDIMIYLISKGLDNKDAFQIMEKVRKGRGLTLEDEEKMIAHDVPDWYIESCKKIKYMFPKAHAVAYVLMSFRIAYYKVNHPESFYATYFDNKLSDFQTSFLYTSLENVQRSMEIERELRKNNSPEKINDDKFSLLEVIEEMYARGYKFGPVDLYKSEASNFLIDEEKGLVIPPLSALDNVSQAIAENIVEGRDGEFISKQDLKKKCPKVTKSAMESLEFSNVISHLPDSNQLSFF